MAAPRPPSHDPPRRLWARRSLDGACAAAALLLAPAACSHDWDTYDPRLGSGGGGTSSAGGSGGEATTSSAGGSGGEATTSSTGGSGGGAGGMGGGGAGGGAGGMGGGGAGGTGGVPVCEPNVAIDCYSGPDGTERIGACAVGSSICQSDGQGYGPCLGEVTPAVEDCALPDDEDCNGIDDDHCGLWAVQYGETGTQRANAIALDAAGNIVVAGRMTGTMTVGTSQVTSMGGNDAFVAKLDPNGQPLWVKAFGDAAEQEAFGVAVDAAGDVVVTGSFAGTIDFTGSGGPLHTSQGLADAFVVKLTGAGAYLWSTTAGGALDQLGNAVATDSLGHVIVAGSFDGLTSFGPATPTSVEALDGFVWKLEPDGTTDWVKTFGGPGNDQALALAVDPLDNVFSTGYFQSEIDFGAGTIFDGGGTDVFLVEIDPAGGYVFGEGYPALDDQQATGLSLDSDGNIVLAGKAATEVTFGALTIPVDPLEYDVFVVKLDSMGSAIWLEAFGDAALQDFCTAAVDGAGDVAMMFSNEGTVDLGGGPLVNSAVGSSDIVIAKLGGASGAHVWSRSFGDVFDQDGRAITVGPMNDIFVTGEFGGMMSFGTNPVLDNVSSDDVFVAKLPP